MLVEGRREAQPCTGLKLVVKGMRENEVRTAEVDQYNFRFTEVENRDYAFQATSDEFEVMSEMQRVRPSEKPQTLKIRVRARPQP